MVVLASVCVCGLGHNNVMSGVQIDCHVCMFVCHGITSRECMCVCICTVCSYININFVCDVYNVLLFHECVYYFCV